MRKLIDSAARPARAAVSLSATELVAIECLLYEGVVVMTPKYDLLDLVGWILLNRDNMERLLAQHGAILFRGFAMTSVEAFRSFMSAGFGDLLEYNERSSPRNTVGDKIYTSTEYPREHPIFLHNEQSYNMTFPLKIAFYCAQPAARGGRTPIANTREVLRRINPSARRRLASGYLLVRNYGDGLSVPWREAFQTDSKTVVEDYCHKGGISFEWLSRDRLRTRQVRPVVAKHPRTSVLSWFNHLTFFHVSTLHPSISSALLEQVGEANLPTNTYYSNGERFEESLLEELRQAYTQQMRSFDWRAGDVLLLDNVLTAHGRESFQGARKVVVSMCDPRNWSECEVQEQFGSEGR